MSCKQFLFWQASFFQSLTSPHSDYFIGRKSRMSIDKMDRNFTKSKTKIGYTKLFWYSQLSKQDQSFSRYKTEFRNCIFFNQNEYLLGGRESVGLWRIKVSHQSINSVQSCLFEKIMCIVYIHVNIYKCKAKKLCLFFTLSSYWIILSYYYTK